MKKRLRPSGHARLFVLAALATGLLLSGGPAALANTPVSGAAFTTVNESVDGTGHCQNGNPAVNCNIYDGKQYVWLNGGPNVAYAGDGSYFFAVLEPGGQADPNDGSATLLSTDLHGDRTFSVSGGVVSYSGTHELDSNKIRLMPYADTGNPGGVYILAICSLADGYPVNASDCKYDAFKVQETEVQLGLPLTVTKDASGAYDNTYAWSITKDVDKTTVKQLGGNVTFTYTVKVSHDGGTIGNVAVSGTISVFNPNVDGNNNTVGVDIDGVSDQLSDGTVCPVTGGGAQTLTAAKATFSYSCSLSALPQGQLDNKASVSWSGQFLDNGAFLDAGSADFTFSDISFAENAIDESVNVTDSYAGTLGTVSVGDANPKTFTYQRSIPVQSGCVSYDNTATFTTNDTGATGSASRSVSVCGPVKTGALTIGFWKNSNGQNLINTYCQYGANNLGTYLAGLGGGVGPFAGAPTSCASLKTYVYNILNGASASDMTKMLKAQMLASALDVWFSGPGWTSTTLNKVKPPSNFLSHNGLGSFKMDLTAICPMVDSLNTGTATCSNNNPSTDAVKAKTFASSPMAMQGVLDAAAVAYAEAGGWFSTKHRRHPCHYGQSKKSPRTCSTSSTTSWRSAPSRARAASSKKGPRRRGPSPYPSARDARPAAPGCALQNAALPRPTRSARKPPYSRSAARCSRSSRGAASRRGSS